MVLTPLKKIAFDGEQGLDIEEENQRDLKSQIIFQVETKEPSNLKPVSL